MSFSTSMRSVRANKLIINTCIGSSIGVFTAWDYSKRGFSYEIFKKQLNLPGLPDPSDVRSILDEYFVLKAASPQNYPSWIGSAISHQDAFHIAFNLLTFQSFATMLTTFPTARFAGLIFGSAIASSGLWLYETREKHRDHTARAIGFSGVVSGVMATCTMFAPLMPIRIMGIVPMPLLVSTGGYFLVDTYMMQNSPNSRVGHAAHVGGGIFGIVFYALFYRKFGGVLAPRRF